MEKIALIFKFQSLVTEYAVQEIINNMLFLFYTNYYIHKVAEEKRKEKKNVIVTFNINKGECTIRC